jgi:ketosteroid isomerase-like protein
MKIEGTGSFGEAERVAREANASLNAGDLKAFEALLAGDVEYVTRDGVHHGRDHVVSYWEPQLERFAMDFELERIIDAGDGTVIVLHTVVRRDPETGEVEMRAWPAIVARVRDGRIVFLEGYRDRRKAFSDLGLDPAQ